MRLSTKSTRARRNGRPPLASKPRATEQESKKEKDPARRKMPRRRELLQARHCCKAAEAAASGCDPQPEATPRVTASPLKAQRHARKSPPEAAESEVRRALREAACSVSCTPSASRYFCMKNRPPARRFEPIRSDAPATYRSYSQTHPLCWGTNAPVLTVAGRLAWKQVSTKTCEVPRTLARTPAGRPLGPPHCQSGNHPDTAPTCHEAHQQTQGSACGSHTGHECRSFLLCRGPCPMCRPRARPA